MSRLMDNQKVVQNVAEAIAAVLNVEVTIIDDQRMRVAAAHEYKSLINTPLPKHSGFEQVLQNKTPKFINRAQYNEFCSNCSRAGSCRELYSIAYPITFFEEIIGVIGIIGFTEEQRNRLIDSSNALLTFLGRISSLITSHVYVNEIKEKIRVQSQEIKEIADNCDEGIIATDYAGTVKYVNREALRMLGVRKSALKDKSIDMYFPELNPRLRDLQRVMYRNKQYLASVKPIILQGKVKSQIITIREYEKKLSEAYNLINREDLFSFDRIIGEDPEFKRVKEEAAKVSKSSSVIMLRGETGTGKELFARAIHANSTRKNQPFIAINCASIPENLLESEFFGYEGGAFTGASSKGKVGKLELANKGTIFLDEVGDLPLHLQPKLLRVLQGGEFTKLGSNRPIKVDVRVICATHKNLEEMIQNREFREDLYYRLNVIPVFIPPLRERGDDILLLANFFMKKYCNILGKPVKKLSEEVKLIFRHYPWPGNVRELENVIEYSVNLSEEEVITKKELPLWLVKTYDVRYEQSQYTLNEMMAKYEKEIIIDYLARYGSTIEGKKKIAGILGIDLSTLYRKINKYGLLKHKNVVCKDAGYLHRCKRV